MDPGARWGWAIVAEGEVVDSGHAGWRDAPSARMPTTAAMLRAAVDRYGERRGGLEGLAVVVERPATAVIYAGNARAGARRRPTWKSLGSLARKIGLVEGWCQAWGVACVALEADRQPKRARMAKARLLTRRAIASQDEADAVCLGLRAWTMARMGRLTAAREE